MNRAERRNKEKSDKKANNKNIEAMKWINSLSPERMEMIRRLLNSESEKEHKNIIGAIERCYTAGIIEVLDEAISIKDIELIMEKCSEMLVEDAVKMNKEKNKCGGDYEMAVKQINSIANEVGIRIEQLIGEGIKPKELNETIGYEYPKLTKAMITNSIKRVREKLKEVKELKEVITREEAEDKLLDILEEKEIATGPVVTNVEEVEEFEIIKDIRILDLKGRYGTYHIEKNVMNINDKLAFCNKKEIQEWASEEIEEMAIQIEKIKSREKEALRVLDKFM